MTQGADSRVSVIIPLARDPVSNQPTGAAELETRELKHISSTPTVSSRPDSTGAASFANLVAGGGRCWGGQAAAQEGRVCLNFHPRFSPEIAASPGRAGLWAPSAWVKQMPVWAPPQSIQVRPGAN